jgi:hypothetical protein
MGAHINIRALLSIMKILEIIKDIILLALNLSRTRIMRKERESKLRVLMMKKSCWV